MASVAATCRRSDLLRRLRETIDVNTPQQVFAGTADWGIHVGDTVPWLKTLPERSVRCCVTSPPYYGLRDYLPFEWVGGDPECSHKQAERKPRSERPDKHGFGTRAILVEQEAMRTKDECSCGATRIRSWIGGDP